MRTLSQGFAVAILLLAANFASSTTINVNMAPVGSTIGPAAQYAAISGTVTIDNASDMLNAVLIFNYGAPNLNLPFTDTNTPGQPVVVRPGDLLFYVGDLQFGIPVATHSNLPGNTNHKTLLAGHLYENTEYMGQTQAPFLTALGVLGLNPSKWPYRPGSPVWLGNAPMLLGSLTESTSSQPITINGKSGYQFTVTLSGNVPSSFVDDVNTAITNDEFSAYFAAATCANGVLVGSPPPPQTPEPSSWLLSASGLLAIAFGAWRNHFNAASAG